MKSVWSLLLLCLTGLILILVAVDPSSAGDENQVGVVVDFGNGRVAAKCVSFPEDSITGFEALQRSGLPVDTDYQTGGAAICRIDGQGCPADDCFCACRGGGECKYWSYWHFVNNAWNYSIAGSGIYQLRDGAVDGWVWGLGSVDTAKPPPALSFNQICVDENAASPTATVTPKPTSTPMILPTRAPTESAPIPTATTLMITATETVSVSVAPTAVTTESAGSTALPVAEGSQTETPIPETIFDTSETLVSPTTASQRGIESYPGQSGDDDPSTSLPIVDASTPALSQAGDDEAGVLSTSQEIAETGVADGLVDNIQTETAATPTLTPVAAVAVVGMGATIDEPSAVPLASQLEESPPWISYAGFVGILLLLAALGLLIYRRRANYSGENN